VGTLERTGVTVPDDISVIGFDDSGVARLSFINLTTVRQDVTRMAEVAVEAIVDRLERGRTAVREVVLDPTLVVRGTTAAPRC
jgi:DNA-binding LacI/PurR family transcriptional regulator